MDSADSGRSLECHDWERILFAGYLDAVRAEDRRVYAMVDGPGYYSHWLTWSEFGAWVERVQGWNCPRLGRHTKPASPGDPRGVALGVMEKLVAWSAEPPPAVADAHPEASFGLAAILALAHYLEDVTPDDDWVACHPINPQWTIRNATGVYLSDLVDQGVFSGELAQQLSLASAQYRAAFECWEAAYSLFGHATSEEVRRLPARRAALVAIVRAWFAHERDALQAVQRALDVARCQ